MKNFDPQKHSYSEPQDWAAQNRMGAAPPITAAEVSLEERVAFIRKVYGLFFAGILFAVGGVWLGFTFPPLMITAAEHPWIMLFVMIGAVMATQAVRHTPGVNLVALFGFTTLTG
jgi:FtsH-binding integral membrane protein